MKDAYYFPHFCNARNDRKIKRIRKELGIEGYGIYFMILETLREQPGFKFPIEDMDLLADEFGTSEQKLRTVVCNYKLFNVDEEENFFSLKFIEYLKPYLETKQRKKIGGIKGNLIKYGYTTKEELDKLTDAEIIELNENKELLASPSHTESVTDQLTSQKKVKESKVKESKVKESKVNNIKDNIKELEIGEELKLKLCEYVDYRKEIKKTLKTTRSITTTINKIGTEFRDEQHLIDSIDNSIANEYQGIFPTKNNLLNFKPKPPVKESAASRRLRELNENNMFEAEVVE